jgi:hypothetical protein
MIWHHTGSSPGACTANAAQINADPDKANKPLTPANAHTMWCEATPAAYIDPFGSIKQHVVVTRVLID